MAFINTSQIESKHNPPKLALSASVGAGVPAKRDPVHLEVKNIRISDKQEILFLDSGGLRQGVETRLVPAFPMSWRFPLRANGCEAAQAFKALRTPKKDRLVPL